MKLFNSILIVLAMYSCSVSEGRQGIMIKSEKDTVFLGERYRAEIYVNHKDSIFPKFGIIRGNKSVLIPVDYDKDCAVFCAVARDTGKIIYEGFVEYVDNEDINRKEDFVIVFYSVDQAD
jgi:hypothetical protein